MNKMFKQSFNKSDSYSPIKNYPLTETDSRKRSLFNFSIIQTFKGFNFSCSPHYEKYDLKFISKLDL